MKVITLRGRVSFWIIVLGGVWFFFLRDVVRILCIFSFLSFLDTLFLCIRSCDHLQTYIVLIVSSMMLMYVFLSPTIYTHASYYLYAIYYLCFTQRCLDEFCLKYFKNTSCQSLLAINSLFEKFFKSLCQDRFYCIQQMNMSQVIYDFSHMFIYLLWFCHGLPKGEIVRTRDLMLGVYVNILCNWLIL